MRTSPSPRRATAAVAAIAACAASLAACGRTAGTEETSITRATAATTTTAAPTTTTAPPPTTAAPPAPVPLTADGTKVVVSERGIVLPVLGAAEGGGVRVSTPCGAQAVVTTGTPVKEAAVVLDAGHGGSEPGARGPGGLTENVLNLAVVGHAEAALERAGHTTVLTRTGDYRMTLGARTAIVSALRPKAFVSVHHNAEPDEERSTPGAETYYQVASADSKRLAGLVQEEVVRALSRYEGMTWVADRDAGAKYRKNTRGGDYYGILRGAAGTPSALAELGFISNPAEESLYARGDVQQVEGEAVAAGIIRYLAGEQPAASTFVEPYPRESPAGSGGGSSGCVDPPL